MKSYFVRIDDLNPASDEAVDLFITKSSVGLRSYPIHLPDGLVFLLPVEEPGDSKAAELAGKWKVFSPHPHASEEERHICQKCDSYRGGESLTEVIGKDSSEYLAAAFDRLRALGVEIVPAPRGVYHCEESGQDLFVQAEGGAVVCQEEPIGKPSVN